MKRQKEAVGRKVAKKGRGTILGRYFAAETPTTPEPAADGDEEVEVLAEGRQPVANTERWESDEDSGDDEAPDEAVTVRTTYEIEDDIKAAEELEM